MCHLRPAEWRAWASAARSHEKPPSFDDPEDFGIAVNAWWTSMKAERLGTHDAWAKIRKSGPNGLVSLLILLLWWGREAMKGPVAFRGDSSPLWHSTVADVCAVLEEMGAEVPRSADAPVDSTTPTPLPDGSTNAPADPGQLGNDKRKRSNEPTQPSKRSVQSVTPVCASRLSTCVKRRRRT